MRLIVIAAAAVCAALLDVTGSSDARAQDLAIISGWGDAAGCCDPYLSYSCEPRYSYRSDYYAYFSDYSYSHPYERPYYSGLYHDQPRYSPGFRTHYFVHNRMYQYHSYNRPHHREYTHYRSYEYHSSEGARYRRGYRGDWVSYRW